MDFGWGFAVATESRHTLGEGEVEAFLYGTILMGCMGEMGIMGGVGIWSRGTRDTHYRGEDETSCS